MLGLRPRRRPAIVLDGKPKLGLMASLAAFFGIAGKGNPVAGAARRSFGYKRTQGNKMLPPEMQQQVMAAAQAKRIRRRLRPQGSSS